MNQEPDRIVDLQWERMGRQLQIAMSRSQAKWHLATRKQEGMKIDPRTAEVTVRYSNLFDPYGICDGLPDELVYVSKMYFARAPGSEIWVVDHDLPQATRNDLWPPEPMPEIPETDDVPF